MIIGWRASPSVAGLRARSVTELAMRPSSNRPDYRPVMRLARTCHLGRVLFSGC